jgi:integrase
LADAKKAGAETFGHYAAAWLASQRTKAAGSEKLRAETVDGYGNRLAVYALPAFGARPIASITTTDCETYLAGLVGRGVSPATLKHHWSVFGHVLAYARRKSALVSNPIDGVDYSGHSAARRNKRHSPLTAEQVAAVAKSTGGRYPVYELFTLFAAYTGLRAEELAGCEVRDLAF